MRGETVTHRLHLSPLARIANFAGVARVEAGVGAGLRRHDVQYMMRGLPPLDVIPTKVGTHASLNEDDGSSFLVRQRNAGSAPHRGLAA